ncbi:MAG: MarR family transcriptional regulator [Spirochaetales bacterium]|nr:MarR family transcriptional regulator [Spirochaetales bacterium]
MEPSKTEQSWTFLTNHSHVLLCLAEDPALRMRDIALKVGITERAVQKIIADLDTTGYIKIERDGRCNTYKIDKSKHLRHQIEKEKTIEELIHLVIPGKK